MAFRLLKRETSPLSRKLLKERRELYRIPGERDLEQQRLKFIRGLLVDGEFNRCDWASCKCKEDGKNYGANGQHTSTVLQEVVDSKLDAKFPDGVPVDWQRWECDSLSDLGKVFDQFDHHRSVRKPKDKLGVFMAEHSDVMGQVGKDFCSAILSGVAWGIRLLPRIQAEIAPAFIPTEAYDRGLLLNVNSVREFLLYMTDHGTSPFKESIKKVSIVADFYLSFLEKDREDFDLYVQRTLYEEGALATLFAKKVRQESQKNGKTPEHFFKLISKYSKEAFQEIADMDEKRREEIKIAIREVMAEDAEEAVA